jgi:putative transposase
MVTPAARREAARYFRDRCGLSERTSCQLARYSRSSYRRQSLRAKADKPLRERLLELASERPRFGYRRLHVMLVREGWEINRKRVYRVYRDLGGRTARKLTQPTARN